MTKNKIINKRKPPIVLLTDFGSQDSFVGIMKGVILNINPTACIVDLNHEIPPQNIRRAAFELLVSVPYFPSGTLFLCVIDPGVGSDRKILFVKSKDFFFLAPDNGLLSWILKIHHPIKIISVENKKYFLKPVSRTFHGRDIFSNVAGHWSQGVNVDNMGSKIQTFKQIPFPETQFLEGKVIGQILSIDRFGNIITNFPNDIVKQTNHKQVNIQIGKVKIHGISKSYSDTDSRNKWLAVEGSHGYLEIALQNGSAAKSLNLKEGSPVSLMGYLTSNL